MLDGNEEDRAQREAEKESEIDQVGEAEPPQGITLRQTQHQGRAETDDTKGKGDPKGTRPQVVQGDGFAQRHLDVLGGAGET